MIKNLCTDILNLNLLRESCKMKKGIPRVPRTTGMGKEAKVSSAGA